MLRAHPTGYIRSIWLFQEGRCKFSKGQSSPGPIWCSDRPACRIFFGYSEIITLHLSCAPAFSIRKVGTTSGLVKIMGT